MKLADKPNFGGLGFSWRGSGVWKILGQGKQLVNQALPHAAAHPTGEDSWAQLERFLEVTFRVGFLSRCKVLASSLRQLQRCPILWAEAFVVPSANGNNRAEGYSRNRPAKHCTCNWKLETDMSGHQTRK